MFNKNKLICVNATDKNLWAANADAVDIELNVSATLFKKLNSLYLVWRDIRFHIVVLVGKLKKKSPIGRPIVTGYSCILKPASIFVEHLQKTNHNKFNSSLKDFVSFIKILESINFNPIIFCLQ